MLLHFQLLLSTLQHIYLQPTVPLLLGHTVADKGGGPPVWTWAQDDFPAEILEPYPNRALLSFLSGWVANLHRTVAHQTLANAEKGKVPWWLQTSTGNACHSQNMTCEARQSTHTRKVHGV